MILTVRTDKPEAYIAIYENTKLVAEEIWHAHKELSVTILEKITKLIEDQGSELQSLTGVVVFKGPGSFTGLRIGITICNTIAHSLEIPIVGTTGEEWITTGLSDLVKGKNDEIVKPEYGSDANITTPKK